MRDNNNKLEYKLKELEKEINKLKIQIRDHNRVNNSEPRNT
jgi:peptidoglycan hydrolase CwlO-like protein